MERFDLCVLGGGPAGYAAAMRGLDFGKKVLLVEKSAVGGAGIYNGALTSKTMWEVSRESLTVLKRNRKYGLPTHDLSYLEVVNEVKESVYERKSHLEHHLFWLKSHPSSQHLLRFEYGIGRLVNPNRVSVSHKDGSVSSFAADNIVLATGSRPRYLSHIPIDENIVCTSDGVLNWTEFPESLVILGAGVIGCEFATIFSNFGKTKVSLISKDSRILPFEDPEISSAIEENFALNNVHIHKNAELRSMRIENGKVKYELCFNGDYCEWYETEKALISIGRVPNLEELGVNEIGLNLNKRGFIDDNDTQTNIPNIYAVGDLTADISLVNVGELEGRHAVERIFGNPKEPLRYDNISTIMFLNPETASVGMNESQAQNAGLNYRVVTLSYANIARAVAMRNTGGFFKILVSDDDEMRVLGMRALGEHASSAIQAVSLLMSLDKGIEHLAEMIHPHPAIVEGIQEAMRVLLSKPIFRPHSETTGITYCTHKIYRDGSYINVA